MSTSNEYTLLDSLPQPKNYGRLFDSEKTPINCLPSEFRNVRDGIYLFHLASPVFQDSLEPYTRMVHGKRQGTAKTTTLYLQPDNSCSRTNKTEAKVVVRTAMHHSGLATRIVISIISSLAKYKGRGCVLIYQLQPGWQTTNDNSVVKKRSSKAVTEFIRDTVDTSTGTIAQISEQVKDVLGSRPKLQQIYNATRRATRRRIDRRGRTPFINYQHLLSAARSSYFVQRFHPARDFRLVMYKPETLKLFINECFVNEDSITRLRQKVTRMPNVRRARDLRRVKAFAECNMVEIPGFSVQLDTGFLYSNHYLTVLCYRSRSIKKNGRPHRIPVVFFLHRLKRSEDYMYLFDALHQATSKMRLFPRKRLILPSLTTDDCPAIKLAIRESSLFHGTTHLLCTIHARRNLVAMLKRARKPANVIKGFARAIFGAEMDKDGRRSSLFCALDLATPFRKDFVDYATQGDSDMLKWLKRNEGKIDQMCMTARMVGNAGMSGPNTNLIEGFMKDLPTIAQRGKSLTRTVDSLGDYASRNERELREAVLGTHPDMTVEHSVDSFEYAAATDEKKAELFKETPTSLPYPLEDVLPTTTMEKLVEACPLELLAHAKSAIDKGWELMPLAGKKLIITKDKAFMVCDKYRCQCTSTFSLCPHILMVFLSLSKDDIDNAVLTWIGSLSIGDIEVMRAFGLPCGQKASRRTGLKRTRNLREEERVVKDFVDWSFKKNDSSSTDERERTSESESDDDLSLQEIKRSRR